MRTKIHVSIVLLVAACGKHPAADTTATTQPPFAVAIHKVELKATVAPNATYEQRGLGARASDGNVFACVQYGVTNVETSPKALYPATVALADAAGKHVAMSPSATSKYVPNDWKLDSDAMSPIAPRAVLKQAECFEVATTATAAMKLLVDDGNGRWKLAIDLPAAAAAAPPANDTVEVSDAAIGYAITIPSTAKVLRKIASQHTYSQPLPGGLDELNIAITSGKPIASLDAAVKAARTLGDEAVDDKQDLGNAGYLVVLAPTPKRTEVHAFARTVAATCSGPTTSRARLLAICRSLRATKP